MNKEELQIRKKHRLMYQINGEYIDLNDFPAYKKFNEKNIKILKEYEKNKR